MTLEELEDALRESFEAMQYLIWYRRMSSEDYLLLDERDVQPDFIVEARHV